MSNSLWLHGLQHARLPCAFTNCQSLLKLMSIESVMLSKHLISFLPFSCCLQSFQASGSFPMNQFFASGGQSIGASASASVLPMNIQDWFPLGLTGLISLQSKGLSRVGHDWVTELMKPIRTKYIFNMWLKIIINTKLCSLNWVVRLSETVDIGKFHLESYWTTNTVFIEKNEKLQVRPMGAR